MSRIDMSGKRFGRLVGLRYSHTVSKRPYWVFQCDCGKTVTRRGGDVRLGKTGSCGCLRKERTLAAVQTHGRTRTAVYGSWMAMRQRCLNPNNPGFKRYGARGIAVCERWASFANFLADMGEPSPGQTLDRIDNAGNYEPGNCRWATYQQQARNTRRTRQMTYAGRRQSMTEWAEELGVNYWMLKSRANRLGDQRAIQSLVRRAA